MDAPFWNYDCYNLYRIPQLASGRGVAGDGTAGKFPLAE